MINTENLTLIQPSMKYLEDLYKLHTNDEATKYTPLGRHKDREDTARYIKNWQQHWKEHNFGYFLLQPKGQDFVVGIVGYEYRFLNDQRFLNLYYRLLPDYTGQNYAYEVISHIDEWMTNIDKETTKLIRTRINNKPSIKLAKRLEFLRDISWNDIVNKGDICFFKD
ncbi:GNAT family N-acetyltransferase [Staphylococcus pasteuri]|uniref:GNAT family N-acetyltransferase n=1 Tax=Staphylococcus pasteuri TaxID=45972 RepID=UPI003260A967